MYHSCCEMRYSREPKQMRNKHENAIKHRHRDKTKKGTQRFILVQFTIKVNLHPAADDVQIALWRIENNTGSDVSGYRLYSLIQETPIHYSCFPIQNQRKMTDSEEYKTKGSF